MIRNNGNVAPVPGDDYSDSLEAARAITAMDRGNGHGFDNRRRILAEQRTGQIVMLVPNLGYMALSDIYRVASKPHYPETTIQAVAEAPEQPSLL